MKPRSRFTKVVDGLVIFIIALVLIAGVTEICSRYH